MCLSSWDKSSPALILLGPSVPSPSPSLLPGFAQTPATPAGPGSTVPPAPPFHPYAGRSTDTHTHTLTRAHSAAPLSAGHGLWGGSGLGLHIFKGGPSALHPHLGPIFLQPGLWLVALFAFVTPTQGPRLAQRPLSRTPGLGSLLPGPMGSASRPAPPGGAHPLHPNLAFGGR